MKQVCEKSHRLPRSAYQGEVTVSFTLCIQHRSQLFADAEVTEVFTEILRLSAQEWRCLVPAYCFMPDHLHLVLHGERPSSDVRKMIIQFKQRSGYWLCRHRPGISWQKDFHDRVLRHDDDIAAHIRYVLDNPCRKGLAADWADYPMKGSIGCVLEDVLAGLPL